MCQPKYKYNLHPRKVLKTENWYNLIFVLEVLFSDVKTNVLRCKHQADLDGELDISGSSCLFQKVTVTHGVGLQYLGEEGGLKPDCPAFDTLVICNKV